jgi:membrane associated rhomboid family serine protease
VQVIGHDGWGHLQHNLILLLLAGPACEAALGPARLSKVMCWTSVASSCSHVLLGPAGSVQLGASSIVFALILLNSLLERRRDELPITFVLTAALWLHRELFDARPGTATSAHLVGAAVGTYFGHRLHVRTTRWGGTQRKFD